MKKILKHWLWKLSDREYLQRQNSLIKDETSNVHLKSGARIENCNIHLINSTLFLEEGARVSGYNISVANGLVKIGSKSLLYNANTTQFNYLSVTDGSLNIGDHSKVMAGEIVIRFGGNLTVGNYTAINDGCEIRCDERIEIGSFNMISYGCLIYDTNTHCIYTPERRRRLTISEYPNIGVELAKPKTKKVVISDDCWIGTRSTILKGVTIGNCAIIATGAVVTKDVPQHTVWAGNPARFVKQVEFDNPTDHKATRF